MSNRKEHLEAGVLVEVLGSVEQLLAGALHLVGGQRGSGHTAHATQLFVQRQINDANRMNVRLNSSNVTSDTASL